MPILNQPSKSAKWVSAYRPVSFQFFQLQYPQRYTQVEVDIFFDGVLYATIRKPSYGFGGFSIFGLIAYVDLFAVDIQRYAQAYLGPKAGVKSDAAPNLEDCMVNTPTNQLNYNANHFCSCYVQVRYLYINGDGLTVTDANKKETSERFYICNATLQHYESYEPNGLTPTQNLKPFYYNSSALFKFLTDKKGNIKLKRGTPQTISFISEGVQGAYYVLQDKNGANLSAGIIPVFNLGGYTGGAFHARIGVSDININSFHYWVNQPPYPIVTDNVKYVKVTLIQYIIYLFFPVPIPISETRTFEFDDCAYSFQLDYLNPKGGFDSFVFSNAEVKSKLTKQSIQFERSLAKAGYNDGTWNVRETGANDLNIEQKEVFTVTVQNCDEESFRQLKQLVRSPEIYMYVGGAYLPVITEDETNESAGWKILSNKFTFSFSLANKAIIQRK